MASPELRLTLSEKRHLIECLGPVGDKLWLKLRFDETGEVLEVTSLNHTLKQIWQLLKNTTEFDGLTFNQLVLPYIQQILQNPRSFTARLDSPKIKTSSAHQGETVLEHLVKVLEHLPTDFLRKFPQSEMEVPLNRQIALLRFLAIVHDLGKIIFICGNGHNGIGVAHAQVSVLLLKGVTDKLSLSEVEKDFLYRAVWKHHFFEKLNYGLVSIDEVLAEFPHDLRQFLLLAFADPLSIAGYAHLSIGVIDRMAEHGLLSPDEVSFFLARFYEVQDKRAGF